MKSTIDESIKRLFNPEFINRIDDFIIFNKLQKEDIHKIIDIQLEDLRKRLKVTSMMLDLNEEAKDFLVDKGFDDKFGARPLRRALQRYVEDDLADQILSNNMQSGYRITGEMSEAKDKILYKFTEITVENADKMIADFEKNAQVNTELKAEITSGAPSENDAGDVSKN